VPETAGDSGVLAVSLGEALALFGDARSAPGNLSSEELAAAAGAAIRRATALEVPVLYARQEHTRLAFTYSSAGPLRAGPHLVGTCDALLTAQPWTALTVRTADCLPVALAGGGAVAMVHAGWRGLAADVLGGVVSRLHSEFGVRPADVRAVVVAALSLHAVRGEGWRAGGAVDLAAWARGRLRALGVPEGAVLVLPGCTACSTTYHSFRRDGQRAGRQWSAVVIAEAFRPTSSLAP
jgi:copper oxidase (laccase) domain-containing protein